MVPRYVQVHFILLCGSMRNDVCTRVSEARSHVTCGEIILSRLQHGSVVSEGERVNACFDGVHPANKMLTECSGCCLVHFNTWAGLT